MAAAAAICGNAAEEAFWEALPSGLALLQKGQKAEAAAEGAAERTPAPAEGLAVSGAGGDLPPGPPEVPTEPSGGTEAAAPSEDSVGAGKSVPTRLAQVLQRLAHVRTHLGHRGCM